jgi:curved DNA-binding protein CbpA
MGNIPSSVSDVHIRMYQNLLSIQSAGVRAQMIQTILRSPEHQESAKAAKIYGHLLHFVQVVQAGGASPRLPGEGSASASASASAPSQPHSNPVSTSKKNQLPENNQVEIYSNQVSNRTASQKGNERAVNYFSACLRILELEEEVALTEETLKGAYKKAVIRAHPDKGGSEKEFEAVTRAYAYLGEILKRIHGGRGTEGKVEAPAALKGTRTNDADAWKMVEPVSLNAKNLDMNAFNTMFEKTRIPDPEESGYGDWLKGEDANAKSAPKFSGKFNRDVFHRAFEDENKEKSRGSGKHGAMVAQEQSLASRLGYATELGRTGRDDYTVAANDPGLKYTDLKKAYTEYNTFSHQTSDVQIENRNLDQYSRERDKAPAPLADHEMAAVQAAERHAIKVEEQRKLRLAQEAVEEGNYFERMKKLVIRN